MPGVLTFLYMQIASRGGVALPWKTFSNLLTLRCLYPRCDRLSASLLLYEPLNEKAIDKQITSCDHLFDRILMVLINKDRSCFDLSCACCCLQRRDLMSRTRQIVAHITLGYPSLSVSLLNPSLYSLPNAREPFSPLGTGLEPSEM